MSKTAPKTHITSGHSACPGCCDIFAAKFTLMGAGPNCIIVNPTGCLEVTSTPYPKSAWQVPWIHSLFENGGAVASGVEAGLKALGKKNDIKVIVIAGDGATMDIGVRSISGAFERGHDFTYICMDNEAYMNTGVQRSSGTPFDASTTTSPPGKFSFGNPLPKKNMPAIMAAHGSPYVATTTIGYPRDMMRKVKKATEIVGPTYVHAHAPCTTGWGFDTSKTLEVARLAAETCLWPLYEMENGHITQVRKIKSPRPVEEYLRAQKRFRHLFTMEGGEEEIKKIQAMADWNIEYYGLQ
ncbi:Pyruvate:ferredoxin oxidoreductase, beta subunit [Methanosarcina siciliae C2J]|uniref:Pyruvate:ferredoxin oxidoreductase, beta subunit n=3 Tax=Methanosarcina siciliae TaxID=38027 RepID=A0A0E3PER2_9EURY|nr:thiamine pyrophosphate-dependent enzyme [Methanosarcina siciliae]AKB28833.1 Pyruvate:ferredoxin oxidoreductase, beta subunit [Methanosarcina siciliae T4/M]AKB32763.1 Pyruvate:ferredoxin oxidoreductase, beta subunit [Methanosarcina siciliae HI350]AKB37072.1 Pyruvate:ferredoxin oxidoreductase, beta subunit [Methanosarcina siciliae C2J]